MAKARKIQKIQAGYQVEVNPDDWRTVMYVSTTYSHYSRRYRHTLRFMDGSMLARNKGARVMCRNRKEVKKARKDVGSVGNGKTDHPA